MNQRFYCENFKKMAGRGRPKKHPNLSPADEVTQAKAIAGVKEAAKKRLSRREIMEMAISKEELIEIARVQLGLALEGDSDAAKFIYDNIFGRLPTAIMQSDDAGNVQPMSYTLTATPLTPEK